MLESHVLFENDKFHSNFFRKIITSLVFLINNYYCYICIKIFFCLLKNVYLELIL